MVAITNPDDLAQVDRWLTRRCIRVKIPLCVGSHCRENRCQQRILKPDLRICSEEIYRTPAQHHPHQSFTMDPMTKRFRNVVLTCKQEARHPLHGRHLAILYRNADIQRMKNLRKRFVFKFSYNACNE